MMSCVSKLNKSYGKFFKVAGYFSVSPYLLGLASGSLFAGVPSKFNSKEWEKKAKQRGIGVCVVLTLIPVLPVFTAVTFGLALIASAIAALSAIVAYPTAAVLDYAVSACMSPIDKTLV